jgi:hypothetical protein
MAGSGNRNEPALVPQRPQGVTIVGSGGLSGAHAWRIMGPILCPQSLYLIAAEAGDMDMARIAGPSTRRLGSQIQLFYQCCFSAIMNMMSYKFK